MKKSGKLENPNFISTTSSNNNMLGSSTMCGNVFDSGSYPTELLTIKTHHTRDEDNDPPPKPLLIGTPSSFSSSQIGGEFGVLLLLHGFVLYNSFYSQLIHHIASHGYIVVAPQLYTIAGTDSSNEIISTAAIIDWMSKGSLEKVLPSNIKPNLKKLALSGHSRGGKVAFALALKKVAQSCLKLSALIGIDPVDGMDKGNQTPPPVLNYESRSFELNETPVLVIGSGLGEVKKNLFFPPCAPKGVNHEDFFDECKKPAWYFVVKDYGHLDMLDDVNEGIRGKATYCLCKNGKKREPMRKFVGGVIVAFLNAYLHGQSEDLISIKDGHEALPVEFDHVESRT